MRELLREEVRKASLLCVLKGVVTVNLQVGTWHQTWFVPS
jgi:hypothetical protein